MQNDKARPQKVFIYFDDSGVLHRNADGRFFVYAGYLFLSQKEKDKALASYRAVERTLRSKMTSKIKADELKACFLNGKQKRYLNSILKNCESLACVVDKENIYKNILDNKKSIHRYKDFCLKLVVGRYC